jgi:tetratricopeptide (TPR) repeat protein
MRRISSFIATLLALGLSAASAKADDWPTCTAAKGDEAIAACTRLIESNRLDDSHLATVYNNRGLARQRRGDFNGAIADLDGAILLDPKLAVAYTNRCFTYSHQGDYDRAIADCDQAVRLNPKFPPLVIAVGFGSGNETAPAHSQIAIRRSSLIQTTRVPTSTEAFCSSRMATAPA